MILYAIIILAITAVGGLLLASKVLTGNQAPWALSIAHAILGAAGLVFLIVTAFQLNWPGRLTASLALLVIAALGGFYLASQHLRDKIASKGVVLIHAGVAVTGFILLALIYFT